MMASGVALGLLDIAAWFFCFTRSSDYDHITHVYRLDLCTSRRAERETLLYTFFVCQVAALSVALMFGKRNLWATSLAFWRVILAIKIWAEGKVSFFGYFIWIWRQILLWQLRSQPTQPLDGFMLFYFMIPFPDLGALMGGSHCSAGDVFQMDDDSCWASCWYLGYEFFKAGSESRGSVTKLDLGERRTRSWARHLGVDLGVQGSHKGRSLVSR